MGRKGGYTGTHEIETETETETETAKTKRRQSTNGNETTSAVVVGCGNEQSGTDHKAMVQATDSGMARWVLRFRVGEASTLTTTNRKTYIDGVPGSSIKQSSE